MFLTKLKTLFTVALIATLVVTSLVGPCLRVLHAEPPKPEKVGPGVPPGAKEDGKKGDAAALEGTWALVSREWNGEKPEGQFKYYEWTFKDGKAALRWERAPLNFDDPGAMGKGELDFTLDAGKALKEITFAGKGVKMLGVYKLDGDTLTLAFFGKSETARPKGFTPADASPDGTSLAVWTLKRQAKK